MDALVASAIPRWLEGIQVSRLAPAKRQLARALQREVEEALNRHFSRTETAPPPPQTERPTMSSDSPAQMIAEVAQTMGETAQMIVGAVQMMGKIAQLIEARQQMTDEHLTTLDTEQAATLETQQAMGARLTTLEERHEITEEWQQAIGDYVVETRERVTALEQRRPAAPDNSGGDAPQSDSPILSPQHLTQLFVLARQARRQSGAPVSAQLAALAEAFGVPDVSDLPESAWPDLLVWFEGQFAG